MEIPSHHQGLLGAETVHAVNHVLETLGQPPVASPELNVYLEQIQPTWVHLQEGNIYNAAEVNDVESTEAVRQALPGSDRITPFVFLRRDRRGRTASFVSYLDHLAKRGIIDHAFVSGRDGMAFARAARFAVTEFETDSDPRHVLDELLSPTRPVMLMGNTVDEFMRKLDKEIETRARQVVDYTPVDTSSERVTGTQYGSG
ncbi:hypothetical protein [Haladaptatus sp. NG-SE-30]